MVPKTTWAAQFELTFKAGKVTLAHNLVQVKQSMIHKIHVTFGAVVVVISTRLVAAHRIDGFKVLTAWLVGTAYLLVGRHREKQENKRLEEVARRDNLGIQAILVIEGGRRSDGQVKDTQPC